MPTRKQRKTRKPRKQRSARTARMPLMVGISTRPDYTTEFSNPFGLRIYNQSLAETKGYLLFDLNNCLGYTNYTAVFDYYRINWVKVDFVPILTQLVNRPYDDSTTPTLGGEIPEFVTCIDRDSNSAPTSVADLLVRGNKKISNATKRHTWKFTPNRLIQIYESATTTGYKIDSETKSFLDCADPQIPHYGLKYAMAAASPANTYVYEIRITYNVSFQQKRG